MVLLDFYIEGKTLLFVKRNRKEIFLLNLLIALGTIFILGNVYHLIPIVWLRDVLLYVTALFLFYTVWSKQGTENQRPHNSKYFLYIINNELIYERITPKKEGLKLDNKLTNFDIINFLDEKGTEINIISKNILPWGNRKVQISKEYLPFKQEIIEYLNTNFTKNKF